MEIVIKCGECGTPFEKEKKEYDRRTRKGHLFFYCSKECNLSSVRRKKITCVAVIRKCAYCGIEFESSSHKKHKKCCSIQCAKKIAHKGVDYKKLSETMRLKYLAGEIKVPSRKGMSFPYTKRDRKLPPSNLSLICKICGVTFSHVRKKKTCSEKCRNELIKEITREHPNCGGETNYKKYIYNGVYMDSSWEVELAKWLDENNIIWERDRLKHKFNWTDDNNKVRRYYPDFYLTEYKMYLDPKNKYLLKVDEFKLNQVIKENNINLVYGDVESIKNRVLRERGVINLIL